MEEVRSMNIRYSARARTQMDSLHEFIAERNAAAATAVIAHIRKAIRLLVSSPRLGRTTDEKSVRMLVVSRFPFVVFYTIRKNDILILNVRHTAQDR